MEPEAAPVPQAAPVVETQPVASPAPPAQAAVLSGAHGNAAVARMAGAAGTALSPGTVRALAPHTGNAAIARMLQAQRGVARDGATAAPPAPAAAPAPPGAPPKLAMPGGIPMSLPAGPGQVASTSFDKVVKAADKKVGIKIPIPPPLSAEVGGVVSGLARFAGGVGLRWDRPEAPVTDPMSVNDTVKVQNGRLGATGTVAGGVFGRIGVDVAVAKAYATAQGTVKAAGTGNLTASGEVTRNGVNGQWTGGIKWDLTATGVLTAAASGYFEWKVLWFEGREEIFKLESFPLGTITVKLGGELKPNGDVTCPTRDFDIVLGSPPEARKVAEKRTAPAGGGQAQVAPKRMSADVPPPPEDPKPGANRLARSPDDQPGGQAAPPAGPAAAPGAATVAPAPGGQPQQQRPPEEIAGGSAEAAALPGGAGGGASAFVAAEEPDAVEP